MRVMNHRLVIVETITESILRYLQNGKYKFVLDKKKWLIKCRNHTVNRVGKPQTTFGFAPNRAHLHISAAWRLKHDSYSNVSMSSVRCMIWREWQVQLKFIIPRCPCLQCVISPLSVIVVHEHCSSIRVCR